MRVFGLLIESCRDCPNIRYYHFDGEGESCPFRYDHPFCGHPDIIGEGKTFEKLPWIREKLPEWCPLPTK